MNQQSGILLETGTNELEVLELLISGQIFMRKRSQDQADHLA